MNVCYHCGKGVLIGRSHTHHRGVAGGRWKKRAPKTKRIFYPNLQPINIMLDGKIKRVKLCNKCMKRVKKDMTDGVKPFLTLASTQPKPEEKKAATKKTSKTTKKASK